MSLRTGLELVQALRDGRRMLADGAVGSELLKGGIPPDRTVGANLSHPEPIRELHRRAIAAGAEIITANTFGIPKGEAWERAFHAGVDLAEGAATTALSSVGVLVSVFPAELLSNASVILAPWQPPETHSRLLLIETAVDIAEAVEAVALARRNAVANIAATCHFRSDGTMPDGTDPAAAASALQGAGASVIGANCGTVPEALVEVALRMRAVTDLPLLFQPNAGLPESADGRWIYPVDPDRFAQNAIRLFDVGVSVVGGCCGVTPAHIAAVRSLLLHPQRRE